MFQEVEASRPVIVSRDHNARVRPPLYRWTQPKDWDVSWNMQRADMIGLYYGVVSAIYGQFYNPAQEMLRFYAPPDNVAQARIFAKEMFQLDSFRRGFIGNTLFSGLYGLCFQGSRFYLWNNYAAGYTHEPDCVDVWVFKKFFTALGVGLATSWIPVPFYNIQRRLVQDQLLPADVRRGYKNQFDAALQIVSKDGFFPFVRGAGPIMAEAAGSTFGLFYVMDFAKDKCRLLRKYGTEFNTTPEIALKFAYITSGVIGSIFCGYPFKMLAKYVDELPKNAQGQQMFRSYSQLLWMTLADSVNFTHMWTGVWRYAIRAFPPLFLTAWFADSLGMIPQNEYHSYIVPEEEDDEE